MDIDPDFEFECPKWYDFTQEEDGGHEECLDDSWFEREHPLHEPKDKEQSLKELKPLIELNEKQTDNQKTKTDERTKYKDPKKSLGVKRSVRLMRGEQGPTGRRKLPETTGLKRRNSSEGIKYSKEQRSGGRDEKSSREDFGDNRNFTPPWGLNSPASRPETSEDAKVSPKTALCSPLRGPLMSPPINSPKNTLLVKAVNKAAGMSQKSKRRILPAIPCSNQTTAHLPLRGTLQSEALTPPSSVEETKTMKEPNKSPMKDATNDKQLLNPIRHNTDSGNIMTREQNEQDMDGISNGNARNDNLVSVEDLLKLHNQKVLASKSKYDSNGRRIQRRSVTAVCPEGLNNKMCVNTNNDQKNSEEDLKEEEISVGTTTVNNMGIINEEVNSRKKEGSKSVDSNNESHVMTAEALLKLHNQRIMASRCKYDSNGRRIRTATPSFCAAPTKSEVAEKTSVAQGEGRRSVSTTAVGKKRLSSTTNCETKAKTKQKQQRRSCVAAPKTQETICATENIKQDRIENEHRKTTSTKTAALQNMTSKSSSSNLKRNAVTQDAKCGQKNKRRSCVAAPVSSLSSCTSKGTGLAAQNRQKRRSCVAAPQTPKRIGSDSVDQELKDLIARHNQRLAKKK